MVLNVHTSRELSAYVIRIDRSKFAQAIRNLVSNGVKFTPAGGSVNVSIEPGQRNMMLSAFSNTVPFQSLKVTVTDTGPGISAVLLNFFEICFLSDLSYFVLIFCALCSLTPHSLNEFQENQAKLFTKIIQFNPGKLQKGGGTGLGLFST